MKKLENFVTLKRLDLIGCSIVLKNNVLAAIDSEIKLFILNVDWTLYVMFKESINNQLHFKLVHMFNLKICYLWG